MKKHAIKITFVLSLLIVLVLLASFQFRRVQAAQGTEFVISQKADQQMRTLDATWNAATNQFLVVWAEHPDHSVGDTEIHNGDDAIRGRLVNLDNSLAGGDFLISSSGSSKDFPQVAHIDKTLHPTTGSNLPQTFYNLVVWSDRRDGGNDIWGQLITSAGNGLQGSNFKISGSDGDFFPAVAFGRDASNNGVFLVVWENKTADGESEILGQRVQGANGAGSPGDLIGGSFQVSDSTAGRAPAPSVAYDPDTSRFLVVWGDERGGAADEREIWGQLININGTDSGSNFNISAQADFEYAPSVQYHPDQDEYLVVWNRRSPESSPADVHAQRVSPNGTLSGARIDVAVTGGQEEAGDFAIHMHTGSYIIPLTTGPSRINRNSTEFVKVNRNGVVGTREQVATDTTANKGPAVTVHGYTGTGVTGVSEMLVAWRDARSDVDEDGLLSQDVFGRMVEVLQDSDGDGLLDVWETAGVDVDEDGTIDLNLPALGADPQHKDLFLELDYVAGQAPDRQDIQAMKAAFAAAPVNNPDATAGINLWVDTGNLVDNSVQEGAPLGTCTDGIDNGGDGFIDAADPDCQNVAGGRNYLETSTEDAPAGNCADGLDNDGDGNIDANDPTCLVGDNLGGGNAVTRPIGCLDAAFYTSKATNFAANRRLVFRYAVSGHSGDSSPCGGGRGEIGGNDFVEFNHDGGTIMHELGHNVNLRHGGDVDDNCKPNFVSVMNYDIQFGINRAGGGGIIDYSPPRRAFNGSTRGVAPLSPLIENMLNEGTILDATDANNRFVFVDGTGQKVQNQLNQQVDWNGDGDTNDSPGSMPPIGPVNIDTGGTTGRPANCVNTVTNDTLNGHNDWGVLSIPFLQFGDSADGAINPNLEPEPTFQDYLELQEELNTTDLSITKSDLPDPVVAGETLTYTLSVTNHGPNPSSGVHVIDTLPDGVSFGSASAGCAEGPVGTLDCSLGELSVGETQMFTIAVLVDHDLVYVAGGPTSVTNTATVDNQAGSDTDASNDMDSEDTSVVAVADLEIVSFQPFNAPAEVLVGQPTEITLRKIINNKGPSWPMDVTLTKTASAPVDGTVTPAASSQNEIGLELDEMRVVDEVFTIQCNGASEHTFTFTNNIMPANYPVDTDPDLSNNSATVDLVVECVVPVAINIKPESNPNSLNLRGDASVAILTTTAGEYGLPLAFDATLIDPLSVHFGPEDSIWFETGGATEKHGTGHLEDAFELDEITLDGDMDMVLHFVVADSGIQRGDTQACVKGTWTDTGGNVHKFFGCDSIRTRGRLP